MAIESVVLRKAKSPVVAIIPVHERDAVHHSARLMENLEELNFDVVWHFNGMKKGTRLINGLINWPNTLGYTIEPIISKRFVDHDRNGAVHIAMDSGAKWITPHDADETLESRAAWFLADILKEPKHWVVQWYNVWSIDSDGAPIIRIDPPYIGYKARFYPVDGHSYLYRAGTASLREASNKWPPRGDSGLRILHWGFCRPEHRQWHYERWNGTNGSNYWEGLVKDLDKVKLKRFDSDIPHEEFIRDS